MANILYGLNIKSDASDLEAILKEVWHKYFPNSKVIFRLSSLRDGSRFFVSFLLAGNNQELPSNLWENDPFAIQLSIEIEGNDTYMVESLRSWIMTAPKDSYHAYGSDKVPFRKFSGDEQKLRSSLDKYFSRVKATAEKLIEENRVASSFRELFKEKVK